MQSVVLLFWVVLLSVVSFSGAVREYSNRWTVQIDGDVGEADVLARKHGFVNLGKITENYYSFQHHEPERISRVPSGHLHKGLVSEPNVKTVEQQEMKSYKLLSSLSKFYKPNDLEFGKMWYINRSRDDGPTYNVIDVWKRNITGQGVVVAVIDEGFDPEHPEIEGNYDKRASFDFIDNDEYPVPKNTSVPQYGHGDKCAGVIAAVLNNSNCGVGLAYKAKLGGIRLFFDKKATDDLESRALNHESDYVDIYSNSWGPDDKGFEVTGPGYFTKKALVNGAQHGRNGLGSIYVFAAGNGGLIVKDSCAFNGYVNSIYTIAITGINKDGSIPVYGERCSGIMAVTYSRDIFGSSVVITADADKKCTESFGASSASAAMASGLIALMLSANRKLTWRDVQHIIVWTARMKDIGLISKGAWTTNKAGLKVHDYAGFGLMDASKMVDAALDWTSVPDKFNCTIKGPVLNLKITQKGAQAIIDLKSNCRSEINYLEHVEVHVNLTYSRRGDLEIKLKSPQGTLSKLSHYRHSDSFFKFKDLDWVLMTLHFWGENPEGKWTFLLENSQPNRNNEGILFSWELTLHGTYSDPLAHNPHVSRPGSVHRTTDATPTQKPSRKPSDSSTVPADRIITTDRIIPTVTVAADKFPSPTMKSDKALIRLVVGIVFAVVVTVIIVIYVGYRHFSR